MAPTPSPLPLNFHVGAECGDVTALHGEMARQASLLTKPGQRGCIHANGRKHYILHLGHAAYQMTTERGAIPSRVRAADIEKEGPLLWHEMHAGMVALDPEARRSLVLNIHARLPCGDCRKHFTVLQREMPADYSTAETSLRSSWRWHNAVRKRQGKSETGWEEAAERYGV